MPGDLTTECKSSRRWEDKIRWGCKYCIARTITTGSWCSKWQGLLTWITVELLAKEQMILGSITNLWDWDHEEQKSWLWSFLSREVDCISVYSLVDVFWIVIGVWFGPSCLVALNFSLKFIVHQRLGMKLERVSLQHHDRPQGPGGGDGWGLGLGWIQVPPLFRKSGFEVWE